MKWKKKKQKSLIQATMESGKAEPYRDSVGVKRMQMNAHRYRAICKRKRMDVLSGKLNLHSQLASSANQEVQSRKAESDLQSIGVKRKETDDQSYKAKSKKTRMVDTLPGKLNLHLQLVPSALQEQEEKMGKLLESVLVFWCAPHHSNSAKFRTIPKSTSKKALSTISHSPPEKPISQGADNVKTRDPDNNSIPGITVLLRPLRQEFKLDGLGMEILSIALPAALALAADPITSLVSTGFVGHLGYTEVVQLLLNSTNDPDRVKRMLETVDVEGDMLLHHAARGEYENVIKLSFSNCNKYLWEGSHLSITL